MTVDLTFLSTMTRIYSGPIVVSDLHVVLGLKQNDEGLGQLEVPLEGDVSVVLVVEVLLLAAGSEAPHHGDEPGRPGTLVGVRRLAGVPSTHRLK